MAGLGYHKYCMDKPAGFHAHDVVHLVHLALIFSINAGIYAQLWRVARKHRNKISQQQQQQQQPNQQQQQQPNQQQQQQQPKQQVPIIDKATIMVIVIVALYAIMWAPYFIAEIMQPLSNASLRRRAKAVSGILSVGGYINTVLNSFVYVFLNKELRHLISNRSKFKKCRCCTI